MRRFDPYINTEDYNSHNWCAVMDEESDGDYVLYAEAHAEIERLKLIASDLRELLIDLQRIDDEC